MVVAESVLTPFFTLIDSYSKIDSIWLTTSTSKQTVHIVTDWYESPITIIAIVAVVAVPIVIALMKRKPMPEQTQLERCA